ncbi:preprotein translocase subunit SecA [Staphylococcus gallinarum]|uniref:Preprotein translocase subunit SecA n=1 Tax=Staphylococcus gallinarum TaxID=1293 RepID=A0A380FMH6_STAGA|nr:preprotein translocase subunit SecA [Staphylococcus gallinarum]
MDTSRLSDSRVFQHRVQRIVTKAQRVSEEQGMTMREMSNEYEKSISVQRDLIYQERDKVLNMQRVEDFNLEQLAKDVFRHDVSKRQDNLTQETTSRVYL